ncbi:MAG TPA: polysaccharide deacetylase family protein [Aquabacterium sp.]|nr:polysaccharide deacetylase family protein [Aquabacterium sp.]
MTILIFHRVLPSRDPLFPDEVDAERFDQICRWLRDWFRVLPLDEGVLRLKAGTLPARAAAITFDDGYADNHDVALPILQRHGLTAAFFVATGFLDGGRMWNDTVIESVRASKLQTLDLSEVGEQGLGVHDLTDVVARRRAIDSIISRVKYLQPVQRTDTVSRIAEASGAPLPATLMMRSDQVHALHRAGMQIGAHTVTHPILATLAEEEVRREMQESKQCLERIIGSRVGLFAYPNGKPGEDYDERSVAVARELGFDAALSTTWGAARQADDPFQLPRFTPWDRTRWRYGARLARSLLASYA